MPDSALPEVPRASDRNWGFRTRAIHAGNIPDAVHGSRALPIHQTSAFVFDSTEDAAARFALQKYGNIYSRVSNPTVASFEERIASLEGGLGAVPSTGLAFEPQPEDPPRPRCVLDQGQVNRVLCEQVLD